MEKRHVQGRWAERRPEQGGAMAARIVRFPIRARSPAAAPYGEASYHQAAIDEAVKPVPPTR